MPRATGSLVVKGPPATRATGTSPQAPTTVADVVSTRGGVERASGSPTAVATAYADPDAIAASTPATGCGPVSPSPAELLTSTSPLRAARTVSTSTTSGRRRCRTASCTVSARGATPRLTTVDTVTPTQTTEAK